MRKQRYLCNSRRFRWRKSYKHYKEIHTHYNDVIMSAMASQITCLTIVYSIVYSGADQRKHQSSVSLAFVGNSPVTGEFIAQRASNAENGSISWRHHEWCGCCGMYKLLQIALSEQWNVKCLRTKFHIDRLVQERRNSSALAMELRLSCTDPSIWCRQ